MNNKRIIAIMGPSGAGKTTLGNNLKYQNGIVIPRHATTRERRSDDSPDFYRYFSHQEFADCYQKEKFLIASGDSPVIKYGNGNFYGILKEDTYASFKLSNDILIYTSYKDINALLDLREKYLIQILNLTFQNIEEGVQRRILNSGRNHTLDDIKSRIYWALKDDENYRKLIDAYANTIYTDIYGVEETYEQACQILKLKKKGR